MAPEQIDSSNITHKTDLFAVGVLLFELLTGQLPWKGETAYATAFARLKTAPPDPRTFAKVPDPVAEVILACLSVDPDARPERAAAIADALGEGEAQPLRRRQAFVESRLRVAVMALDGTDQNVAGALTQELIDGLGQSRGLRVLARSMTAGKDASSLEVDRLVEGTVRAEGPGFRIVVRLIDTKSGEQIETLRRTGLKDELLPMADDLVRGLTQAMDVAAVAPARPSALDPQAVELYLKARNHHQRFMMDEALTFLGEAEELAPEHPLLLAGLAVAHARRSFASLDCPPDALPAALASAGRAVRSAPDHAEPRYALGYVRLHSGDPIGAAVAFRQAIARSPSYSEALAILGELLVEVGRPEDAEKRLLLSLSLDGVQTAARWALARLYALSGDVDRGLEIVRATFEEAQQLRLAAPVARLLSWKGDTEGMKAVLRRVAGDPNGPVILSLEMFRAVVGDAPVREAYAVLEGRAAMPGTSARMRSLLMQIKAELAGWKKNVPAGLDALEAAVPHGFCDLFWLDRCPSLTIFREEPRFASVRKRVQARADAVIDAVWGDEGPTAYGQLP